MGSCGDIKKISNYRSVFPWSMPIFFSGTGIVVNIRFPDNDEVLNI